MAGNTETKSGDFNFDSDLLNIEPEYESDYESDYGAGNEVNNEPANNNSGKDTRQDDRGRKSKTNENRNSSNVERKSGFEELGIAGNTEYILFLILILLILGNRNTFDNYFQLVDEQTSKLTDFLNIFTSTSEQLKTLLQ